MKWSDILKNSLKRALERLRTATKDRFSKPSSIRDGLQLPQRMQTAHPTLAQARPQG